jgi:hypothetical protein
VRTPAIENENWRIRGIPSAAQERTSREARRIKKDESRRKEVEKRGYAAEVVLEMMGAKFGPQASAATLRPDE